MRGTMKIGFLLLAAVGTGCAHQEAVKKAAAEPVAAPPAQVAKAPEPPKPVEPPKVDPAEQARADLDAVLNGTILHFDFDQAQLTPESQDRLRNLAEALRAHPDAKVRISGNCDERGTEEYNLALGQRRAEVARKYLVTLGVAPSRVSTVSYGAEKPAAQGHDEQAWSANRRDEFQKM